MKKQQKKKSRRSRVKYPELNADYALKIRQDEVDFDYLEKLKPKELEWLNSFMKEYLSASFPKKNAKGKRPKTMFNEEQIKEAYGRNNFRNRCMYSKAKAQGLVNDYPVDMKETEFTKDEVENHLIDMIDKYNEGFDLDEQIKLAEELDKQKELEKKLK